MGRPVGYIVQDQEGKCYPSSSRLLCLVANVSNSITQERRQIAWSRLNPVFKDVPVEEGKGKKSATLFGESFMEKATKRMEEEKALTKFTTTQKKVPAAKRCKYAQDPSGEGCACTVWQRETPAPTAVWPRLQPKPQPRPESQALPTASQTPQETIKAVTLESRSLDNLVDTCSELFKHCFILYPHLPSLLPSARLPYCLRNWQVIMANHWVL